MLVIEIGQGLQTYLGHFIQIFCSESGYELGSLISAKTVEIKSVVKIQTLGGILDLKICKYYANCPGPKEKVW